MPHKTYPSISVVTPTLNCAQFLEKELKSIKEQNYPQEKIEIIVIDGGSTDNTIKVAKKYKAKVYKNPLKTAEAGKAIGVKKARGELIALIDSDNILPTKNWFKKMVEPFNDKSIVGSEPIKYTYRKSVGFIERHSALIGMNDPIVLFYGNYDRYSYLTKKWTNIPLKTKDMGNFIKVKLENTKPIPTIGANGTVFRKSFLTQNSINDYLFDIDVLAGFIQKNKYAYFAKVKVGIIHSFCESSISKFYKKQKRRVNDFYYYNSLGLRNTDWDSGNSSKFAIIKFILYTIFIFPVLFDSIKGYIRKPDFKAWAFHPLACFITLYAYSYGVIENKITGPKSLSRDTWRQ